ncbi:PQQ-binding-like beta-propeller repeat protein [Plantactinospora sp. S1510]|uniref:PQQ-binding-like beta-propeller repeat protein n=1 Tax=Plantactinospora alkalitolerans TaxID=2789879 RepID=A0ABS0H7A7_9ACTN|nr:PQQ-binding-like beta-propeller repeat protein [Plantactinospora alkalitolerans]MBF9134338.1 PQQ-binding-like beta-propeller repeat protein [Plantactinospora alkalitolerans]
MQRRTGVSERSEGTGWRGRGGHDGERGEATAPRWLRRALAVTVAVLVVAASAVIVHRVLAPAEVVTPARSDYPAPTTVPPGVIGTLNAAPLIVDGRLRVYATNRQIRADQPLDAPTRRTPYWSFRRWPAEVSGLVADGATVVTRWSDGELVALEARTGLVRWRARGPRPDHGYLGRRTGGATVYTPGGLYPAATRDGASVLVVTGSTERRGLDLASGRELWRADVDPACRAVDRAEGLSTTAGQFVVVENCPGAPAVGFYDVATGAPTARWQPDAANSAVEVIPVGCATGRSRCPAIRTSSGGVTRGWLVDGPSPVPAPALDAPESVLVGEVAVAPRGTGLVARSVRTGAEPWQWAGTGSVSVLAAQSGRVHLRTEAGELLTLDSETGRERSRFPFTYGRDSTAWSPGLVYAASGFVAVERLTEPVDPAAADSRYYLAAQPVILAAT